MHLRPTSRRSRSNNFNIEQLEKRALLSAAIEMVMGPIRPTIAAQTTAHHFDDDHDHHQPEDLFPGIVNYRPNQTVLTRPGEFLSGPTRVAINEAGAHYLRSQASVLGVDLDDLFNPIVRTQVTDTHTNTTHTYLQQQVSGLPVMNALANVSIDRYGRVLTAASSFVNAPDTMPAPAPTLSATDALASFANRMGVQTPRGMTVTTNGDGIWFPVIISAPDLQAEPIDLKLVYVAQADGTLSLAWHGDVDLPGGENWWEVGMHATTGEVIFAANYVAHATYNAFPLGFASPYDGGRQLLTDTHNLTASPWGWHDTNGAAGAESTLSMGNNVDAYLDRDNNNAPDANGRSDGGAGLVFDTPLDLNASPLTVDNQMSAVTNLFYHNNIIHDVTYGYGFNEASGNFQQNNYGRGGVGNDPVNAEAQDGGGTNNANFATPADGSRPRMQMYLWTNTNPNRDGDFDQQIIYHEYGHGISNRLTGGAANASALTQFQSRGMGEGWSDFFGVLMSMKATDVATTPRPMSPWALGQPASGNGIRTYPYTTNFAVNPFTAASQNNAGGSVHYAGSVWMTALWEVTWELIDAHGWSSNIYGGYQPGDGGNKLMMQLVIDGMKLQPVNPRYSDARDAILQADMNLTGGANQSRLWAGFARRGFGLSMNSGATAAATTVTQAFDVPTTYMVVNSPANTTVGTAMSSAIFVFNNNINQSSFSVADDVVSFTNPSNQDIKNQITGHSFPAPNTLKIDFNQQNALGTYKLRIGPDILNAVTGQPMDQNLNGTGGEAGDSFEANLIIDPFKGPDLQGYKAGNAKYEDINLVAGQPGVTNVRDATDNAAATISLGTNSFRFYGTTYTTLFLNPNGLITFGTSSTSATNGNMSSTPTQAAIAPLWDDWTTAFDSNDMVLSRYDDLNGDTVPDRLVLEWSEVRRVGQTTSPVTFQGILQLNTGTTNGNITFNYVDLDTGNAASSFGVNASNGIKASGTQSTTVPSNRLLLSQDGNDARWLGEGRAYRLGMDVATPGITNREFDFETGHRFNYTFSRNVQASLDASDLVVTDPAGVPIPGVAVSNIAYNVGTNTATFTLNQILADGNYKVRLLGDGIRDASDNYLDGDGDLIPGGTNVMDFFVLAADANRDRAVNGLDFNILSANFGQSPRTFSQGDFNYDGVVNGLDFNILSSRFGQSLPPGAGGLQGRPGTPPAAPSLPPTGGGIAGGGDSRGGIMRWGAGGGSGSTGGSGSLIGTRVPTSPFGDEPIGLPTDGGGDAIL